MRKQIIHFSLFTVTLLTACSPESYDSPNGDIPVAADYENCVTVTVDQDTNYAYFHFDAMPGVTPVWIIDGSSYTADFTAKKYYRKAGDYSVACKVKNANGISDGTITRTFHVDKTVMNGFGGFDVNSDKNLFKTATVTQAPGYYAPGWNPIADPPVTKGAGNDFTVVLPEATFEQWQAQVPFDTNISTVAEDDVTYDFSVILTATQDHGGVTIKLTNPYDDNDFYFAERQPLTAGEPVCFYVTKMPSRSISNLKLFFDFGGNAAGTEVVVENLVFIKSSDNDIEAPEKSEPEPVWVALDSDDNLWNKAGNVTYDWWYAPGWSLIAGPAVTQNGRAYSFTLPEGTTDRWMAQFSLVTEIGIADTSVEYDFIAIIESSNDFTGLVKLTDASDDNNFFFADEVKLYAGSEARFVARQKTIPNACEKLKLIFDFGGNPAGTEITVRDIILQVHRD